jgi:uncharacterized protein (DUF2062 family)
MSKTLKSLLALTAGVLTAAGGAILTAATWADVATPQGVGGILLAIGGAVITWLAKPWAQARSEDNGR